MRRFKQHFNLIEITLALGVIAIGIVAILALFPVGSNASRDAMASTYSAEAADELLHLLENNIRSNWSTYITGAGAVIQTGPPAGGDRADFDVDADGDSLNERETLYQYGTAGTTQTRRFKIVRYVDQNANDTYEPGTDILDFEAIMVIWRDQVDLGSGPIPYDYAAAINAEISWPAQSPPDGREKDTFYLEIFNR